MANSLRRAGAASAVGLDVAGALKQRSSAKHGVVDQRIAARAWGCAEILLVKET